jgi:hypothetical protein
VIYIVNTKVPFHVFSNNGKDDYEFDDYGVDCFGIMPNGKIVKFDNCQPLSSTMDDLGKYLGVVTAFCTSKMHVAENYKSWLESLHGIKSEIRSVDLCFEKKWKKLLIES